MVAREMTTCEANKAMIYYKEKPETTLYMVATTKTNFMVD
jgi:hypothetical protein